MTIERQHEERCPLRCRFFVYFSMPEALKSVVDVQCTMKCEQYFMFKERQTMHWNQWSVGKTRWTKQCAFIKREQRFIFTLYYTSHFFDFLLFFFFNNNSIKKRRNKEKEEENNIIVILLKKIRLLLLEKKNKEVGIL